MDNRTLNIDLYDIDEARAEAAVLLMRKIKRDVEGAIACVGRQDGIDLATITDALTICSAVSLAFSEPTRVGTDKHVPAPTVDAPCADLFEHAKSTTLKNVAKENAESCGDCRIPRCRFCEQPGERAGGLKNPEGKITERYYICKTPGCIAAKVKTPQPMRLFSGGN